MTAEAATLLRLATRLGEVQAGSRLADDAIHRALDLPGDPPPYTTDGAAVESLLPPGFVVVISADVPGPVRGTWRFYGLCTRRDDPDYPHHGQWCSTRALAKCAAVLRCLAARGGPSADGVKPSRPLAQLGRSSCGLQRKTSEYNAV